MSKLLFETDDQEESHAELERLLVKHKFAECRIDSNSDKPFQVWSAPDPRSRGLLGIPASEP